MQTLTSLTITGNKAALLAINDIITKHNDLIVNFLCEDYASNKETAVEMVKTLKLIAGFNKE